MYLLIYILIRDNQYILMHTLREAVVLQSAYCGVNEHLSEHVYTTHIQHKIHTICLYNMPIQQADRKIKRKIKLTFIEVIKGGTFI